MLYYFAFSYYVTSVVFVFVDNVVFVYRIVLILYDMLMFYYLLRTGAVKYLFNDRFVSAVVTTVGASAWHMNHSFIIIFGTYYMVFTRACFVHRKSCILKATLLIKYYLHTNWHCI